DAPEELLWLKEHAHKTIVVGTKYDKLNSGDKSNDLHVDIKVSAKEGKGIEALKDAMYNKVITDKQQIEGNIVTNARHFEALQQVEHSLHNVSNGMEMQVTGDLLAPDIRNCLYHLGTITGQVEIDRDILGTIFGKFCI